MGKGMLALLLLTAQAVLLVMLAFLFPEHRNTLTPVSLNDVLSGRFAAKGAGLTWGKCGLKADDTYWQQKGSEIWCVSPSENLNILVVNGSAVVGEDGVKALSYSSITLSPNGNKALLATNVQKIWRHSYVAEHYVINVPYDGQAAKKIVGSSSTAASGASLTPQRFASWSPKLGSSLVAFVAGCNLFVSDLSGSNDATITQVTKDGIAGDSIGGVDSALCFGVPDWVYEEEVLATADATWWSPDGTHLAFLRSDDSDVPITQISYERANNPYPQTLRYRMPKPGYPNPIVDVLVYSLADGTTSTVDLHSAALVMENTDASTAARPSHIVGRVQWASASNLIVRVFNRIQNTEQIVSHPVGGSSSVLLTRHSKNGWLRFDPPLLFLPRQSPSFASVENVDGFLHIVLYEIDSAWTTATRVRALTSGPWTVTSIAGYSQKVNSIVFTSTENGPTQSTISAVPLSGQTHQVLFNSGFSTDSSGLSTNGGEYLVASVLGPGVPTHSLVRLSSNTASPLIQTEIVSILQDNAELIQTLSKFAMPERRFTQIRIDAQRTFDAYIIVPFAFDESGSTKYPVLFKVYNGPGSQGVLQTFGISFDQYVASLGIVVVQVDGRGTTGRGLDWEFQTYMDLGDKEPKDQIDAAVALSDSHEWVDKTRMSIWGWSYGGYVTSRVAGLDVDHVFRVKVAVAPVTDWRFYDSIYTERYMGLPQTNVKYETSAVMPYVKTFDDSFLLVHGLADDNVQYINSAVLEEALIAGGKHYSTRFYPNRDHSIVGGNTRENLYSYLVQHFERYLL